MGTRFPWSPEPPSCCSCPGIIVWPRLGNPTSRRREGAYRPSRPLARRHSASRHPRRPSAQPFHGPPHVVAPSSGPGPTERYSQAGHAMLASCRAETEMPVSGGVCTGPRCLGFGLNRVEDCCSSLRTSPYFPSLTASFFRVPAYTLSPIVTLLIIASYTSRVHLTPPDDLAIAIIIPPLRRPFRPSSTPYPPQLQEARDSSLSACPHHHYRPAARAGC